MIIIVTTSRFCLRNILFFRKRMKGLILQYEKKWQLSKKKVNKNRYNKR